ncbi:flagellar protein [Pectinatus sottacetonis]|uniref:flagellar protein n=1 Tax=Pectinatus sottacetonis TaxID=1002795 RepID=UPI0018C4A8A3|nr:flagellar protein [Pectinatus sottacetonis]
MVNKMRNCPECGKLFIDTGAGMCRDCLRKEEESELIVSSYLRDNPGSTIKEIYDATGVKERTIMRMIRAGRFIGKGKISYPCERCGTLITEGRYCNKCMQELKEDIKKATDAIKQKQQKNNPSSDTRMKSRGMYSNK